MKIGIDASQLIEANKAGTVHYLYNLVKSLVRVDKNNDYTLYFKEIPTESFLHELSSTKKGQTRDSQDLRFSYKTIEKSISWTQAGLAKECLTNPPDILLCPWQTMPIIHSPKTKIVSVIHGFEYKPLRFGPTYYTCLFSDHLVAVSNFVKTNILRRHLSFDDKVTVVHEGVDTNVFYPRDAHEHARVCEKYNIISKDYTFFIGAVNSRKNMESMLRAYATLIRVDTRLRSTQFVIGGSVWDECEHLYDLPKELDIEANVLFLGRVPAEDLPGLLSGARFLSFVSLEEGFGLPVLESMACGTPVLTTTAGAVPEIAGEAALLVNPLDIQEISEGMTRLFSSDAESTRLLKKLTRAGTRLVENYTWEQSAKGVLNVF